MLKKDFPQLRLHLQVRMKQVILKAEGSRDISMDSNESSGLESEDEEEDDDAEDTNEDEDEEDEDTYFEESLGYEDL
ncbi:hypothetical protein H2248_007334 [Termitomyces sp. 'cryptogamus']|nr:hypothetical protein H2248_007334 [Termitomyces sp. 'cryptogamus']